MPQIPYSLMVIKLEKNQCVIVLESQRLRIVSTLKLNILHDVIKYCFKFVMLYSKMNQSF
jgi:hypothetical protein